ncbi:MAG: choice-of-anchor D domain-containing protein [bacterium]|nr:MAG: choice-of-anchor D domain-containing protein [bacterium]
MKTFLTILFIFTFLQMLKAQTPIYTGTINGSTWDHTGSPYLIYGDVTVEDLTISEGVVVKFQGNFKFEINGILEIYGLYSDSVYFQPSDSNTVGWPGIKFRTGSSPGNILRYFRIEGSNNPALHIDQSHPTIENSRIVHNNNNGIYLKNTSVQIKNCIIQENLSNGIELDNASITSINSIISDCDEAGILSTNAADSITLVNSVIAGNQSGITGGSAYIDVLNSIVYENLVSIISSNPNPSVLYSCIEGSPVFPGTGNINDPPVFSDSLPYLLESASPCVDAGHPDDPYRDSYFPPSRGGLRNDMGAYGGPLANGWFPPLYLIPQFLDFGRVSKDSISSFDIQIENYRNSGITVTDIIFSGTHPEYFSANKNNFYLPASNSTDLTIYFTPAADSLYSAELLLETLLNGTVTAPISGEGVIAEISLLKTSLDFGDITLGDSAVSHLPILNSGKDTLHLTLMPIINSVFNIDEFQLSILPDSSTDSIRISCFPDTALSYVDSLIILSNDPENPFLTVPLLAQGYGPVISVSSPVLEFGQVKIPSDSTLLLVVRNSGNDILSIHDFSLSQPDSENTVFFLEDSSLSLPLILPEDSSYILPIRFKPLMQGNVSGELKIHSSDPFRELTTITLSGEGIAPEINVSTNEIQFGSVFVYKDTLQILKIFNLGSNTLIVERENLEISGPDSAAFRLDTLNTIFILHPGDSTAINLLFSPSKLGNCEAELEIISNDPAKNETSVDLTGTGVAPELTVSTSYLSWGQVPFNTDSLKMLTLYNEGDAELIVYRDSLIIHGLDSMAFLVDTLWDDIFIDAGDSADIPIRFLPSRFGEHSAALIIESNDPFEPVYEVILGGLGVDIQPASITLDPEQSTIPLIKNQNAILSFHISSVSPVDSASLFARKGGKTFFQKKPLTYQNTDLWTAQLDSSDITERGLEYFVKVDHGYRTTILPETGMSNPSAIQVSIPQMNFPQLTLQSEYKMISIPFSTFGQTLYDLFYDDLGPYDPAMYRFFDYIPGQFYVEIDQLNISLAPGKALWLITLEPKQLDVSNGQSLVTNTNFTLPLQAGWNMISSPYAFPLSWNQTSNELVLWYYNETDWDVATILQPFEGYAVYSPLDTALAIPPREATGMFSKNSGLYSKLGWKIQLSVRQGELKDEFNFVGIHPEAVSEVDVYDYPEPPRIGKHIQLYLNLGDSDLQFARDFRPPEESGYAFEFQISGNVEGSKEITFHPEHLPEKLNWTVVSTETHINYGQDKIKTFLQKAKFTLLVGEPQYMSEQLQNFNQIPTEFKLYPNYPNPFNPNTTIKFQLPQNTSVTIKVYNLLGQLVQTLMEENPMEAGYYSIEWNGRNSSDQGVSSGIYFLQIKTQADYKVIKMILQR